MGWHPFYKYYVWAWGSSFLNWLHDGARHNTDLRLATGNPQNGSRFLILERDFSRK